jgi:hypothetical protein
MSRAPFESAGNSKEAGMSKLGAIGLAGIVVGLVLGLSVQALSASTRGGPSGERTFVLVTRQPEVQVLDFPPSGLSEGDTRVFNLAVYNAHNTRQVGRLDGSCQVTDPPDEAGETRIVTQCVKTFVLTGGSITVQGDATFATLTNYPYPAVQAITGGTGAYQGARGQVDLVAQGANLIQTVQLIP